MDQDHDPFYRPAFELELRGNDLEAVGAREMA